VVTDNAGAYLFPTWREFLIRAADRTGNEGQPKKRRLIEAQVENDMFLEAAEAARDALGPSFAFATTGPRMTGLFDATV
jgi:hypothetical protein